MGSLVYLAYIVGHLSTALSHGKWLTRRAAYTQCDVTSVRPVHAVWSAVVKPSSLQSQCECRRNVVCFCALYVLNTRSVAINLDESFTLMLHTLTPIL
jgi:hypothetical protein